MISTLSDDNCMYIKPMIEACREGMFSIVYEYNTCIKFALSFMVLSIIIIIIIIMSLFYKNNIFSTSTNLTYGPRWKTYHT